MFGGSALDIIDVFRSVADLFIYYCSIRLPIRDFDITIGAVLIFCGIAGILISFIKGMAE